MVEYALFASIFWMLRLTYSTIKNNQSNNIQDIQRYIVDVLSALFVLITLIVVFVREAFKLWQLV